jgi:NADH-quinone oxidoreductase subunit I
VCPFDALFWAPEFEHAVTCEGDLVHERAELRQWLAGVPAPLPTGTASG